MTIQQLIDTNILRIALLPPSNWRDVSATESLTLPLIAEDYPAKTAVMWNTTYRWLDMPDKNTMMVANPKDVANIIVTFRSDPKYRGGGIGVGFKEIVIPHLDEVTPLALAMGAVNIVKKTDDGRLIGDNTDGLGYAESLEDTFGGQKALQSKHILILGAGGSGRAIAFALADFGAKVTIINRTADKAVLLAESLNAYFGKVVAKGLGREHIASLIPSADAVVSVVDDATSPLDAYSTLGTMELPVTSESVEKNRLEAKSILQKARSSLIVSDIRIRTAPTPMLVQAERLGFKVLNGIPMVVNQGVRAFSFLYEDLLKRKKINSGDINRIMKSAAQS